MTVTRVDSATAAFLMLSNIDLLWNILHWVFVLGGWLLSAFILSRFAIVYLAQRDACKELERKRRHEFTKAETIHLPPSVCPSCSSAMLRVIMDDSGDKFLCCLHCKARMV